MPERTVQRSQSQPSKGDSGFSKAIIGAIVIYAAVRYLPFLAALGPLPVVMPSATAQAVIPSRLIKVVEFDDRGRTYRVDLESGRVTADDAAPQPEPPKPTPVPPKPEPTPQLTGLALRVNEWFRGKVTTRQAETAAELAQAIETTLAVTGGLGLRGQQILDELGKQIDAKGLRPRLAGFPLGDALKMAVGDDPAKIVPALRDAMRGLEAIR